MNGQLKTVVTVTPNDTKAVYYAIPEVNIKEITPYWAELCRTHAKDCKVFPDGGMIIGFDSGEWWEKAAASQSEIIPYGDSCSSDIEFSDEISHPGGAWVLFDCDSVADKIIDRNVVGEVAFECKVLHEDAMNFWKNTPPTEFVDDQGRKWRRE
jgi:hypothetical protein